VTTEVMPRLLQTVKRQVEASQSSVPFVLQLGDLLEGLCGTPELADRQAREALDFVKQVDFGRPLLFIKGNHDITGPGAVEAYDKLLVPSMVHPGLEEIRRAAFTQTRGDILFVFYDAYDPKSLPWFEQLVAERRP